MQAWRVNLETMKVMVRVEEVERTLAFKKNNFGRFCGIKEIEAA